MKKKISGFAASGHAQPEIRPNDIFKDKYGGLVTVKSVGDYQITYNREGYSFVCVASRQRFERSFTLVRKAPAEEFSDIEKIMSVTGAERIRVVREIIRARGKSK
ncbi:TPA: DUF4222 domain-containing protein [Salmonella enterica]|nr:DUF4222 domain-containing protein [Salmonella enterica]